MAYLADANGLPSELWYQISGHTSAASARNAAAACRTFREYFRDTAWERVRFADEQRRLSNTLADFARYNQPESAPVLASFHDRIKFVVLLYSSSI
jgi:hypothetical protein